MSFPPVFLAACNDNPTFDRQKLISQRLRMHGVKTPLVVSSLIELIQTVDAFHRQGRLIAGILVEVPLEGYGPDALLAGVSRARATDRTIPVFFMGEEKDTVRAAYAGSDPPTNQIFLGHWPLPDAIRTFATLVPKYEGREFLEREITFRPQRPA